ncbi:hypothetical protein SAMN06295900_1325 [Trinickia caryophylli]|uniref:Uncharacterized protein n=1 Tax=Trinickia caryophylli TaxID=28094 RepID=A0A1X7HCW4_TRICW|nr:hypothetical protein SAMN06295900_1325 [Trinickia caryophylli]
MIRLMLTLLACINFWRITSPSIFRKRRITRLAAHCPHRSIRHMPQPRIYQNGAPARRKRTAALEEQYATQPVPDALQDQVRPRL